MQCNQPFFGNGFTNGPIYNCNNTPLQCSQNMCPEIVGEGEVTSVTMPDGTIQFFFMPTMKWWAPNASQYPNGIHMANPMYTNMNQSFPQVANNNNAGTWFVRSISSPFPPNTYNVPTQRNEVPRLHYNSDYNMNTNNNYNMNTNNNGYQLKFHNDNWTSTTDLHYFFPNLRQREYTIRQSCKGNMAIQVDTAAPTNKTNHCEFVCSKPCNCNVNLKPMSVVSLAETQSNENSNSGFTDDCSCDEVPKNHRRTKKEKKRHKPKKVVCACESTAKILTADKPVTTYTDESSSCTPASGQQTQTCEILNKQNKCQTCCTKLIPKNICERPVPMLKLPLNFCEQSTQKKTDHVLLRCEVNHAETWQPITSFSKKVIESKSSENQTDTSDHEYNGGCSSNCSCYSG